MIRMLKEEDIQSCLDIYNWYIQNTNVTFETEVLHYDAFSFRVHEIMKKYPWIVLEEGNTIVGYAYLDAFHERAAYSWTCDLSIYIDRFQKSKGYGKQLMEVILFLAEKDGYHNVISIITEGNQASEHIHEAFGFEKKGFIEKAGYKAQRWSGVSYYVKKLKDGTDGTKMSLPENLSV